MVRMPRLRSSIAVPLPRNVFGLADPQRCYRLNFMLRCSCRPVIRNGQFIILKHQPLTATTFGMEDMGRQRWERAGAVYMCFGFPHRA